MTNDQWSDSLGMLPNMGAKPGEEYGQEIQKLVGSERAHALAMEGAVFPMALLEENNERKASMIAFGIYVLRCERVSYMGSSAIVTYDEVLNLYNQWLEVR